MRYIFQEEQIDTVLHFAAQTHVGEYVLGTFFQLRLGWNQRWTFMTMAIIWIKNKDEKESSYLSPMSAGYYPENRHNGLVLTVHGNKENT